MSSNHEAKYSPNQIYIENKYTTKTNVPPPKHARITQRRYPNQPSQYNTIKQTTTSSYHVNQVFCPVRTHVFTHTYAQPNPNHRHANTNIHLIICPVGNSAEAFAIISIMFVCRLGIVHGDSCSCLTCPGALSPLPAGTGLGLTSSESTLLAPLDRSTS